ncbi:ComF family protein [Halalkalibacterium halodurans]|nr:ComF family protein [Halalkalibacterium halodurans]MED4081936.1 ComF family protein [Halalkalibacterium halodurans]MED4083683.1 ComF family protein [Halalkalibacterium halodurans]MED4106415.1 ComF family protein [Halalkalibacterium halodurans]MED4107826.1 ComF family protein [Halalkalibacterium halodurans]MED4124263.1 ComF family protein [Halalkalibacterium halodurans]
MPRCLICHQPFFENVSWSTMFFSGVADVICQECEGKFQPISNPICSICGRSMKKTAEGDHCLDCKRWLPEMQTIEKNRALFEYNPFLKNVLTQLKFRGDVKLAEAFHPLLKKLYQKEFKFDVIVPIPLSKDRLIERGFNQVEALLAKWCTYEDVLARKPGRKQSKKSRIERIQQRTTPFMLKGEAEAVEGRSIVLVDDVYTTGATIRQAATVLQAHGAARVRSMTIAR